MALRVAERILDLIGHTPLLRLGALERSGGAAIWAKLEYLNPGDGVEDRGGSIGGSYWPGALDRSLIDEVITVPDDDALEMTARLARECGVLSSGSGGAAVHAAVAVAARTRPEGRVVTVVPDGMERYLSKGNVPVPTEAHA